MGEGQVQQEAIWNCGDRKADNPPSAADLIGYGLISLQIEASSDCKYFQKRDRLTWLSQQSQEIAAWAAHTSHDLGLRATF